MDMSVWEKQKDGNAQGGVKAALRYIFKTPQLAAYFNSIGSKVTLHASNGLQVTGTTTSGVAAIVAKDGDAAGSRVLVRFE